MPWPSTGDAPYGVKAKGYIDDGIVATHDDAIVRIAVETSRATATEIALQAAIDAVGGGAVDSVNTQTGVVVLDAADVGAATPADVAATAAALAGHTGAAVNVHGIVDTANLATKTALDALQAALVGSVGYDPTEPVFTNDERYYRGSIWRAKQNLPVGIAPLGTGDGSLADQVLLLDHRVGFASWVTGGFAGTVVTVANNNDTGAGSLRQAIIDHMAANAADSTRRTWIVFDKTWNVVGGVATYEILLGSDLIIAGKGSQKFTIDARGVSVTIDGGGTPGVTGVGVLGNTINIGGIAYGDFTRGSNTTPAGDIIIHGIALLSNWGGESPDTGSHGDFEIQYWARGVWVDHCAFTNPDPNHDGLFDIGYGATDITVSWCHFYNHAKALLVNDNLPGDTGGLTLPPGVTEGSPGGYEVVRNTFTLVPHTLMKVTYVHNHKQNLAVRGPFAKQEACRVHCYNEYLNGWGAHKDVDGVTLQYYPNFRPGETANSGSGIQAGSRAQVATHNIVCNPLSGTTINPPLKRAIWPTASGINGYMSVSGFVGLSGADYNDGNGNGPGVGGINMNPQLVFSPTSYYGFILEDTNTLPTRLTLATGPTSTALWEYVGPGAITAIVGAQENGVGLGVAGANAPAQILDFAGAGLDAVWDPDAAKVTVTVLAGAVDPTTILLVGTALPAAGSTYEAKRFRVVTSLDAPIGGTEYECRHNTTLNVWEWQQVAAPVVPAVIPGQELVHISYHPTAQQTNAQTLGSVTTTIHDFSADAITAGWTGVSASTFDATFVVPPSRVVLVELEMLMSCLVSKEGLWGLKDVAGSATITNSTSTLSNSASRLRLRYQKRLDSTVLPAIGASFTVRPQWYTNSATGNPVVSVGGIHGPFRVRVMAST